MSLKRYDVIRTMIPYETFDDKESGRRTLDFDKLLEAQISGNFKYNRPCVILGTDKESGDIIMAEMRSNRDKPFRSMVNDINAAGIDHESAILVSKKNLIYVEPSLVPTLEPDKCGHLSNDDIKRFEKEFMSVNFRQAKSYNDHQQEQQQSKLTDKQLLTNLQKAENKHSGASHSYTGPELA